MKKKPFDRLVWIAMFALYGLCLFVVIISARILAMWLDGPVISAVIGVLFVAIVFSSIKSGLNDHFSPKGKA